MVASSTTASSSSPSWSPLPPPSLLVATAGILVLMVSSSTAGPVREVAEYGMVEAAAANPGSAEVEDLLRRYPEFGTELLAKMRGIRPVENKRGIDFGLGRGYSGNQAAKHFMGLVASQYAGGPGKRKRKRSGGLSRVQPILYDDGSRSGILLY